MTNASNIAAVLRTGREIWLDPADAIEMAVDLDKAGYRLHGASIAPALALADEMDNALGAIRGHVTTYQLRQALETADDVSRETITTVDELIALPHNAALITKDGTACQIGKYSEDSHYLHFAGSDQSSTLDDVDELQRRALAMLLPAEVVRR
jgi:hypothetical protein